MGHIKNRSWICYYSQTGTEIYNLSNAIGIYPDAIVTNGSNLEAMNKDLLAQIQFREHKLNRTLLYFLPHKPVTSDYEKILSRYNNPVITLHGYLRIIPKEICEKYEIYNLHPGLINKFPSLKGFNPQERAFREGYKLAGCVIHRVVPEVDAGEILLSQGISIEGMTLPQVYHTLHNVALDLWKSLFAGYKILDK